MSKIGKMYYCTVPITAVWQPQKFQSFIMVEVLLYIANYVVRMCRASFASSYSCVWTGWLSPPNWRINCYGWHCSVVFFISVLYRWRSNIV